MQRQESFSELFSEPFSELFGWVRPMIIPILITTKQRLFPKEYIINYI